MFVCQYACMCACLYACMFVCLYACLFVYYATHGRFACRAPTFYGPMVGSSKIQPTITLSTDNRVTLCSYYRHLSVTLRQQLRTIVDNVMRLFFDCPKLRNTRARCR